jgi:hypothetical protein|tara:strand:- start:7021 stop:7248 length:228 start_codon:yes stop_codon:yes gene_type:complete
MEKRFKFTGPDGQIEYDMVETDGMEEEIHAENIRTHQAHPDHADVWVETENGEWELIPPLTDHNFEQDPGEEVEE